MSEGTKHWTEDRTMADAPAHYDAGEAQAWASGWDAAVAAAQRAFNEATARESARGAGGVLKSRGGA